MWHRVHILLYNSMGADHDLFVDRIDAIESVLMLVLYLYSLSDWEVNSHEEHGLQVSIILIEMTSLSVIYMCSEHIGSTVLI